MLNKKGDISVGFVIALVIGVIVLAAAAYFIVKGTTPITDAFDAVPGKLQIFASACQGYAEGGLSISYCEFKSVDTVSGITYYANCENSKIRKVLVDGGTTPLSCNGDADIAAFCVGVTNKEKVVANDKLCSSSVSSTGFCSGNAALCSSFTSASSVGESNCRTQAGCSWVNNACIGTAKICSDTSFNSGSDAEKLCRDQEGCTWTPPAVK